MRENAVDRRHGTTALVLKYSPVLKHLIFRSAVMRVRVGGGVPVESTITAARASAH